MIRVEETRRNDKRIPFLVTWTSDHQVVPKTQIRNAESVRHTAVRENKLAKVVCSTGVPGDWYPYRDHQLMLGL
jgi:hypothetical protein